MNELSQQEKEQIYMVAENLYNELDEKARDVDSYDFGLPMFSDHKIELKKIIVTELEKEALRSAELVKALEDLINDVKSKPNDTRYTIALKAATEALNKYNKQV